MGLCPSFQAPPLKCPVHFQEVERDHRCDRWADGHHQQGRRSAPAQPRWQQHPGDKMRLVVSEFTTTRCHHHAVSAVPQVISEQSDAEANAAKIPTFFPPGPLPPNIPPPPFLPPPPNVSAAPPLIPPPSTSDMVTSIFFCHFLEIHVIYQLFYLPCISCIFFSIYCFLSTFPSV